MCAWRECVTRTKIRQWRRFRDDQQGDHQRTPTLATRRHTIPRLVTLIFFIRNYCTLSVFNFIDIRKYTMCVCISLRRESSTLYMNNVTMIFSVNITRTEVESIPTRDLVNTIITLPNCHRDHIDW